MMIDDDGSHVDDIMETGLLAPIIHHPPFSLLVLVLAPLLAGRPTAVKIHDGALGCPGLPWLARWLVGPGTFPWRLLL